MLRTPKFVAIGNGPALVLSKCPIPNGVFLELALVRVLSECCALSSSSSLSSPLF